MAVLQLPWFSVAVAPHLQIQPHTACSYWLLKSEPIQFKAMLFRSHLYYPCSFSLNVKFWQNKQKDPKEEGLRFRIPTMKSLGSLTAAQHVMVLNLVVARLWSRPCHVGTHILQYHLPPQGQQKVTVKVGCKAACPWQVWSCIWAQLAFVLNISWPNSRLAACHSFQTKHSAPFLKTWFWLLLSAMLCLVIITLSFPPYGLHYRGM